VHAAFGGGDDAEFSEQKPRADYGMAGERQFARSGENAQARERAAPLLERFGLGGFEAAWPWQLSGGMRQRAAFLRTVLLGKPAMLLDEPFGALDGITRSELQQWLLEVWSEVGSTVALITHDVAEAVFLADRVYVMTPRPGRVAAVLDVDLPRPRTLALTESPQFGANEARLRELLRAEAWPAGVSRSSSSDSLEAVPRLGDPS